MATRHSLAIRTVLTLMGVFLLTFGGRAEAHGKQLWEVARGTWTRRSLSYPTLLVCSFTTLIADSSLASRSRRLIYSPKTSILADSDSPCCSQSGALTQWEHTFGPYPIRNTGDNTNQMLGAPSGTRVSRRLQNLCSSAPCTTDVRGRAIIKTDLCERYIANANEGHRHQELAVRPDDLATQRNGHGAATGASIDGWDA
jgi:hypothetical protein